MSKSLLLTIRPSLLIWARESINETIEAVAGRLKVEPSTVLGWENGNQELRLTQLEKLAQLYRRPLAAFFLPRPPEQNALPKDFRSYDGVAAGVLGSKTIIAIRRAERNLEIAESLGENNGGNIFEFPREATTDAEILAAEFRKKLRLSTIAPKDLKSWKRLLESCGVFVLQSNLPEEDARGFSIRRGALSSITLSSKDSSHARIFTLFHECCHLILRDPGICIPTVKATGIEAFCNEFAASFLVPTSLLLVNRSVIKHGNSPEWSESELTAVAASFGVSKEVILRRLLSLKKTTKGFYASQRAAWKKSASSVPQKVGGVITPDKKCLLLNGERFIKLVLTGFDQGVLSGIEVADYLGVKLKHLPQIQKLIEG